VEPSSWPSRHPSLAPYWREYLPLISQIGGIRLFDRAIPLLAGFNSAWAVCAAT